MESRREEALDKAALTTCIVDRLVALGEEGMASGVNEAFDIDAFVDEG